MKDDLTDKQRQLVDTIVATGCSIKEAAEKAGYSSKGSKEAARVSASRTLRLPKVQSYMQQRIAQTLGLGAVSASKRLIELSTGARSEYVQLEASRDILDRVSPFETRWTFLLYISLMSFLYLILKSLILSIGNKSLLCIDGRKYHALNPGLSCLIIFSSVSDNMDIV